MGNTIKLITFSKGNKIAVSSKKSSKLPNVNNQITVDKVRLVAEDGSMLGICPLKDALSAAQNKGLDLVEISPQAEPPVCKMMDFGRFRYESKKKAQNAKKKQRVTEVKEIKLRPNIGNHDFQIKMKNIRRFLEAKDKVKITLRYRGREVTHQEVGTELLNRIKEETKEIAKVEFEPKMEGKQVTMVIAPK